MIHSRNLFFPRVKVEFTLALRGKLTYYPHSMLLKALRIVSLLVIVIAAPIVDAIACDDCNDILPFRVMQQSLMNGAGPSDGTLLSSSDGRHAASQGAATAQDLCPVCANIAAAMDNTCCSAPSMISQADHLPQMLALLAPSYPINKPPQS
jgi:hypothetical protein